MSPLCHRCDGETRCRNPADRPDPELEHAFSKYVDYGFDTIEFIGSSVADDYPFAGERYAMVGQRRRAD